MSDRGTSNATTTPQSSWFANTRGVVLAYGYLYFRLFVNHAQAVEAGARFSSPDSTQDGGSLTYWVVGCVRWRALASHVACVVFLCAEGLLSTG